MQEAHNDHPRNGEDRRRRIDQVHRAIQAQQGRVDADDLTEILDELTDDQLDTLLKQIFGPGQPPHDPSFAADREPDQAETAASDLHEQIVGYFRTGDGLPLPLFGGADLPLSLLVRPFLEANDFRTGTETSYRKAFERLIDVLGDQPPSALTSKDLDGYADALRAQRSNKGTRGILSAATLAKDIGHIRQFFAAVAGSQPDRNNPAVTLKVPKRSKAPAGASRITPLS